VLQTRSSILLVAITNTAAGGGSAVVIINSQNLGVNIQNSAGWVVSIANTIAGGNLVSINNSAGWVVYAQQSGAYNVNILNSSALQGTFTLSNSSAINITNTVFAQSNTSPLVQVTNSAGWIVSVANTSPLVSVQNSAGWVMAQSNTAGITTNIINSANWVIAQSNTNGLVTTYDTNRVYDGTTSTVMKYKNIVIGGSGNTLLVNAVSGKRIRLISMVLISNGTGTVYVQNDSTSATNLIGPMFLAANVGFVLPFHQNGWCQTGTSILLNLSSSTINSMGGCLTYLETS